MSQIWFKSMLFAWQLHKRALGVRPINLSSCSSCGMHALRCGNDPCSPRIPHLEDCRADLACINVSISAIDSVETVICCCVKDLMMESLCWAAEAKSIMGCVTYCSCKRSILLHVELSFSCPVKVSSELCMELGALRTTTMIIPSGASTKRFVM